MALNARFEVFQKDDAEWRFLTADGNEIADSGDGYRSKRGVERGGSHSAFALDAAGSGNPNEVPVRSFETSHSVRAVSRS